MTQETVSNLIALPIWVFREKYQRNTAGNSVTCAPAFPITRSVVSHLLLVFWYLWHFVSFAPSFVCFTSLGLSKFCLFKISPLEDHALLQPHLLHHLHLCYNKKNSNKKLTNKNDMAEPINKKSTSTSTSIFMYVKTTNDKKKNSRITEGHLHQRPPSRRRHRTQYRTLSRGTSGCPPR